MGNALMPPDENRVYTAIGLMQGQLTSLSDKVDDFQLASTTEHRKVHDIVDALSEAVRNLTRLVEEMKPLTDDYREKRAEARGAAKFATALWVSAGGIIMLVLTTLKDALTTRGHP